MSKPLQGFLFDELAAADRRRRMLKFWWTALCIAARRGGDFNMARAIFFHEFGDMPPADFPCQVGDRALPVAEVYPKLLPRNGTTPRGRGSR